MGYSNRWCIAHGRRVGSQVWHLVLSTEETPAYIPPCDARNYTNVISIKDEQCHFPVSMFPDWKPDTAPWVQANRKTSSMCHKCGLKVFDQDSALRAQAAAQQPAVQQQQQHKTQQANGSTTGVVATCAAEQTADMAMHSPIRHALAPLSPNKASPTVQRMPPSIAACITSAISVAYAHFACRCEPSGT